MATAILSGRVEESVKAKAAVHLRDAGVTAGDVIRTVWEAIAATGEVPRQISDAGKDSQRAAFEKLMLLRDELPPVPELASMDKQQMRDMIAERHL